MLDDPGGSIRAAREAGVGRMISVGIGLESCREAIAFARSEEFISAAIGVHPHDASSLDAETLVQLESLARTNEVVAIGETGLDYYRNRSTRDDQRRAFISQIELARKLGKPLLVHSREAQEDTLEILRGHAGGLTVVLHCFSLVDRVTECAESGYFMSIAGNLTYRNAQDLRRACQHIPETLLLTETDSPFLAPMPHRGKANQPAYVAFVLEELSKIRGVSVEELAQQVAKNFQHAFPGS